MRIPIRFLPIAVTLAALTAPSAVYAQSTIDYLTSIDEGTLTKVFSAFEAEWETSERTDGKIEYQVTLSGGLIVMALPQGCGDDLRCERVIYYAQFAAPQGVERPQLLEIINDFNFNHSESSAALFDDNNVIIQSSHRVNHGSSLESVAFNFRRFDVIANALSAKLYADAPE